MGHLIPFSRLALALSGAGCVVSIVSVHPAISAAESLHLSELFSSFPHLRSIDFHLPPASDAVAGGGSRHDPFYLRFHSLAANAHLLAPLLSCSTSPPISALVVDITLTHAFIPVAASLSLPCHVLFTSSAAMLAFCASFPAHIDCLQGHSSSDLGDVRIPGLFTLPESSIPTALRDQSSVFSTQFIANGRNLMKANGFLINTFAALEPDALRALNDGSVISNFPPVIAVGPLRPIRFQEAGGADRGNNPELAAWLDEQPERSILYVSFGSRTTMSREQMQRLAIGLEKSGSRFVWVVKTVVLDREEGEVAVEEIIGEGFVDRVKGRGMVVKGWVEQEQVLSHRAVGGFLSHCGWNSVTEAAALGKPVLAWPRAGDQRVNAGVVKREGLGAWKEEWGWEGDSEVVEGEEIALAIREFMAGDVDVRPKATRLGEEAAKAVAPGGSSYRGLGDFVRQLLV